MLSQYDLDSLMQTIQADGSVDIYYVAHMIEPREGILDEHIYKSSSKFKVIKVTLTDIYNAFFELLYFLDHTDEYHTEEEDSYYDRFTLYKNLYTVKNSDVIIVLDHGRIIERGSHDDLLAAKGQYYRLYTGAFELE